MNTFTLQIVTPDGEYFNGEAERLVARAIDGDVCIMANHTKYVTALSIGVVRVRMGEDNVRLAACNGGMLSCIGNTVRVVANNFEWAEDIDLERAQRAKEKAQLAIDNATDDKELAMAKAKMSRALLRIHLSK